MPAEVIDLDAGPARGFRLREYQREWMRAFHQDVADGWSRLLLDAVGGSGKTSFFAALLSEFWREKKGRVLVLENRQQLVDQTAKRIRDETGLEVDIEMADQSASPYAPVVVASVATLGRVNRLTAFTDNHFALVVFDECHHSLAPLHVRIARYFHYGAQSLQENWQPPKDGTYQHKALILGVTATPDLNGNRSLGELYQKFTGRYSYLQAIDDGWLVGLKEVNIPVKIDTRKFRVKRTSEGSDFSPEDESKALIPVIEELAEQIVSLAKNRKTMAFLPSLECAELMAAALNRRGLKALFVSGECLDKEPKTDEFQAHKGGGICLCLCALYVEGTDFPDVDTVAWMRATLSAPFYKQGVYRCSRTLPGLVHDDMTPEQRRAAIAASAKPYGLLISPFFISDRIDLCSMVDLFVDAGLKEKMKKAPREMTDPDKIRDFIKSLEDAADKHKHKQPRTIDPVRFAVTVGDSALAGYKPENAADSAPPSRIELDYLLKHGIDTSAIKYSGQAQLMIQRLETREKLGLATPTQMDFLRKLTKNGPDGDRIPLFSEDWISRVSKKQAGAIAGRQRQKWSR